MLGYQLKWEQVHIVGADPLMIRSLLDKQQFFDEEGVAERLGISSAMWPLFGLLWPSGHVLADWMVVRSAANVRACRILEIGCGLGLASLVAQRCGADICASDAHPLAQAFLNANTQLNALPNIPFAQGLWGCHYPLLGEFDLIVGSDVLYERDEQGVLAQFIARHARAHCEVVIVDPNRGNRSHFSRHMLGLGFVLTETVVQHDGYRGRVLCYQR